MRTSVSTLLVIAALSVAGLWVVPVHAQQEAAQPAAMQQDTPNLTPPPAYTPPPKGAPPAVDTPAQAEALAKMKERNEEKSEADRKAHNEKVTPAYNFHYGPKNPFTPGNIQVKGEGFIQPGAFPTAEYCGTCHQEAYSSVASGASLKRFSHSFLPHQRQLIDPGQDAGNRACPPLRQLP